MVQAAVSYALMFQTDPMRFLDRPSEDLPVLLTLLDIGDTRIRKMQEDNRG